MSLNLLQFRTSKKESIFDIYKKKLNSKSTSCKNIFNNMSISKDNSSYFNFQNKTSQFFNKSLKDKSLRRSNSTFIPYHNIMPSQTQSTNIKRKLSQILIETLSLSHEEYSRNKNNVSNNDHCHNHINQSHITSNEYPMLNNIENKRREIMKLLNQNSLNHYKNDIKDIGNERLKMTLKSNKYRKKYMTSSSIPLNSSINGHIHSSNKNNNILKNILDFKCTLQKSMDNNNSTFYEKNNENNRYSDVKEINENNKEQGISSYDSKSKIFNIKHIETPKRKKPFNFYQCYSQNQYSNPVNEEQTKLFNTVKNNSQSLLDNENDLPVKTLQDEPKKEHHTDAFTFREQERIEKERNEKLLQEKNVLKDDSFEELKKTLYFREFYCDD